MGNYSYICKCGKPICTGEKVHFMHIRHGKVLGHAEGEFNGYGTVYENEGFDNASFDKWDGVDKSNPNCHDEVMKSCFDFDDSEHIVYARRKIYQGKPVSIEEYSIALSIASDVSISDFDDAYAAYKQLKDAPKAVPQSGVAAYHKVCYDKAVKNNNVDLTPSESDPNQGFGKPRKEFI